MLGTRVAGAHRPDTVAMHSRAVQRVIGAMREHIDEPFSLEQMAALAIMSPFHFNRTFCELTGIPPCQFLSSLRIETAKRLLLTTNLSVTDVCLDVGYNSLGTFIRRFTELVGVSPRRLRHLARLGRETAAAPSFARPGEWSLLAGRVEAPTSFRGPVFVGLFEGPIPQGQPVACAALSRPGPYTMAVLPRDGRYRLFAAGVSETAPSRDYYLCESALRGGGQTLVVSEGRVCGDPDIVLRSPQPTDPPILLNLTPLGPSAVEGPEGPRPTAWPGLPASV